MNTQSEASSSREAEILSQDKWSPKWWKEETHRSAWDRVKEAMSRDWSQTKHQFDSKAGHELNQGAGDTLKQVAGTEAIPSFDKANPPKVIGQASDGLLPMRYGFGARQNFGTSYPNWNPALEAMLRAEWATEARANMEWAQVQEEVRYAYEYRPV